MGLNLQIISQKPEIGPTKVQKMKSTMGPDSLNNTTKGQMNEPTKDQKISHMAEYIPMAYGAIFILLLFFSTGFFVLAFQLHPTHQLRAVQRKIAIIERQLFICWLFWRLKLHTSICI